MGLLSLKGRSQGGAATLNLHPQADKGASGSPDHVKVHGCDVGGFKPSKGRDSGLACGHSSPSSGQTLYDMNTNIHEVEAKGNPQRPASSSGKVARGGKTWIIWLISFFVFVVLSVCHAGSLLGLVEGKREGCVVEGGLGMVMET